MRLNRSTKEQFKEKVYKKRYGNNFFGFELHEYFECTVVNKAINSFIRQRTWALHVLKMSVRKNWIFLFSCDWLNLSSYWLAEIYNWRQQWAVIG